MNKTIAGLVKDLFGDKKLTAAELWALVKMFRIVRLRCRNNTALNNQLNAAFPYASFRTVTKSRISRRTGLPETYPGLDIIVDGVNSSLADDSDE